MFRRTRKIVGTPHFRLFCKLLQCKNFQICGLALETGMLRSRLFVQNLAGENCLVVPPTTLIARALFYLRKQKAYATVIVPFWPSSYFWPVINRQLTRYIVDYKVFNSRALTHGRNTNSLLGSNRFHGEIIALRMAFI